MVQIKKQNSPMNSGIQILLLLSLLAFISSRYSSLISTYFSSFKLFSSTSTDRHYIFLLCNGLMLLVIKTSGLFSSPAPPATQFNHVVRNHVHPSHHQFSELSENIHVKNNVISHQPVEFNSKNNVLLQIDHLSETEGETDTKFVTEIEEPQRGITVINQGGEYMTSTTHHEEKEQANHLNSVDEQEQGQEEEYEELEFVNIAEEEEQGVMLWSTEELNKKCDDFIRKMKYGLRFEAPLVML